MKLTKCKICREPYKKWSVTQKTCEKISCALKLMEREKEKTARKVHAAAKAKAKSRAQHLKETQAVFNRFIRLRDEQHGCIDCGGFPKMLGKYGGDWDAGHYLSVGAYPELRFNEDNCHKQLKCCNAGAGKFSHKEKTVTQGYRERLILKIGIERVEILEGPHEPAKHTIPELIEIKRVYAAKCKAVSTV